ncbi:glycoside hydrolase family 43 protein [Natronosporangium hydrolyticum]|uniref:Glycoside hydrolase family 43 protein n=1 Tax=Natronosporangium hydrolyticum TaxID=2811111 RepID=A0A895Y594_9ACTN|nr:glycoside hydrolase family 43 protein [Natronosporangium hydrolyticum]QSB12874.1 glycoside hydrolase family 43 protein [Natronosporangium hydrolyticum]
MTGFHNPAVAGFHPDPSVCRAGDDYYLACSSFEYFPGIPIFHSRDLVRWELIGHVVDRPGQLALAMVPTLGGAWAPTLRFHAGRFWVVVTDAMGRGSLLFTADDPAGPWTDGVLLPEVVGIDPDLAWDAEGSCYVTFSGLQLDTGEHHGILQVRIDPVTGRALTEPRRLWSGTGLMFPEAPHLYEIDGTWYLLIAEGGTERGHAVSVARAPHPAGPFEGCPTNPVLSARSTDRPVQNTGHGDLIRTPDGSWALLLLGMRPRGLTRAFSPMGRETFITGVTWVDGWPLPEPVVLAPHPDPVLLRDDFDRPRLAPEWVSVRTPAADWSSLSARPGWLVLTGDGSTMDDPRPRFVGRRQQHPVARFSARVDAGAGAGGLSLRIDEDHHYDIEVAAGTVRAQARVGPLHQTWQRMVPPGPVLLQIEVGPPPRRALGPDVVRLSVDPGTGIQEVAALDGRYVSAETAAAFTGRVVGMYASEGEVGFDWFHYEGSDT